MGGFSNAFSRLFLKNIDIAEPINLFAMRSEADVEFEFFVRRGIPAEALQLWEEAQMNIDVTLPVKAGSVLRPRVEAGAAVGAAAGAVAGAAAGAAAAAAAPVASGGQVDPRSNPARLAQGAIVQPNPWMARMMHLFVSVREPNDGMFSNRNERLTALLNEQAELYAFKLKPEDQFKVRELKKMTNILANLPFEATIKRLDQ